ncbi:MAG TPA: N-formylglutamate amidohydrolase [Steroidobacteraceae bacterium]|jgi:predicted N-formylglutamate amidohydrolase|nr:N-formylglutamate amidohydrolase [Steroidobacteraceae bacterium]
MNETPDTLLAPADPPAFTVDGGNGTSPFLFVADHAGRRIPQRLGQLGLADAELERHIAWDIGAGAVACLIGKALNAVVIRQTYSRLVIDCNRRPGSATSIVKLSELTPVPGNLGLSDDDSRARLEEIFKPYHNRIAQELDRRRAAVRPAILISVHSFTPVFKSVPRPWHVGVLHNRDPRCARILLELLNCEEGLIVGDNEPYSLSDESDYTIPIHGEQRGLPHVELEIRQDLITQEAGQQKWAALLVRVLPQVYERLKS